MTIYYLAARPETIISIVREGKFPSNVPVWLQPKRMECFSKIISSIRTSTTNFNQTFILELEIPEPIDITLLTIIYSAEEQGHFDSIVAKQINPEWINRILVYSIISVRFLNNLFSNECPKNIVICPDVFPQEEIKQHPLMACIGQTEIRNTLCVKQGDILESHSQTIINTVNCVGIMGKGIALCFKQRYPEMFNDYKRRCERREVKLGEPYLYKVNAYRWILNFPTKWHWRNPSRLSDIETGLRFLSERAHGWGIQSLAIPPLGCGNGGLNWNEVLPLIKNHLTPLGIPVEIYEPFQPLNTVFKKRDMGSAILAPALMPLEIASNLAAEREVSLNSSGLPLSRSSDSSSFHSSLLLASTVAADALALITSNHPSIISSSNASSIPELPPAALPLSTSTKYHRLTTSSTDISKKSKPG